MRTEQMTLDPFFVFRQCHTKSWWTDPRLLQSIYPWARYWTSSCPWYWNKNGGSSSTHSHGESWHQKVVVIWTYNELNQLWSNLLAQCYTDFAEPALWNKAQDRKQYFYASYCSLTYRADMESESSHDSLWRNVRNTNETWSNEE